MQTVYHQLYYPCVHALAPGSTKGITMRFVKHGFAALLGAVIATGTAHAYTITGQVAPSSLPFAIPNLGTAGTTGLVSDATLTLPGETITFAGGTPLSSGVFYGTVGGTFETPYDDTTITPITNYLNAEGGGTVTITYTYPQTSLDLLWGSIDSFNSLTIGGITLTGATVAAAVPGLSDDAGEAATIEISGLPSFTTVSFTSLTPAVEFIPGVPVPEPPSW
jgi:hypothetical protein